MSLQVDTEEAVVDTEEAAEDTEVVKVDTVVAKEAEIMDVSGRPVKNAQFPGNFFKIVLQLQS